MVVGVKHMEYKSAFISIRPCTAASWELHPGLRTIKITIKNKPGQTIQAKPVRVTPGWAKPGWAKPGRAKPGWTRPGQTEPG
mmetsp:Transcript_54232/g.94584  ORF Transcript_54232/g.94584 Transcript_54232/m.94584 type:complete len:82 (+) Transcript_54232:466-711(+)